MRLERGSLHFPRTLSSAIVQLHTHGGEQLRLQGVCFLEVFADLCVGALGDERLDRSVFAEAFMNSYS